MQAVLLRGGLTRLTEQTHVREENAALIRAGLARLGGPLRAARRDPRVTRQAYYAMTLCYDPQKASGLPKAGYLAALAAEGCAMSSTYWPVYSAPLLNLYDRTSPVPYRKGARIQDYRNLRLPNTEKAVNETAIVLMHAHLMGSPDYTAELLRAVDKVNHALPKAAAWWRKQQAESKR